MRVLELIAVELFAARFYRYDVEATTGYGCGEKKTIAAAPLIHSYSPQLVTASTRLALKKNQASIIINNEEYKVIRYLTTQELNDDLLFDEDNNFTPTVKPHYAIAPANGPGMIYSKSCKVLLNIGDTNIFNDRQSVLVHDGRLSPMEIIPDLAELVTNAVQKQEDLFLTSYVIDDLNKQVLITEHCLLNQQNYHDLFSILDKMEQPTIESLLTIQNPIHDIVQHFDSIDTHSDLLFLSELSKIVALELRIAPGITSVSGAKLDTILMRSDLKKAQVYRGPLSIFSDPNASRWCSDLMLETEVIPGAILS